MAIWLTAVLMVGTLQNDEDAKLNAFFDAYLKEWLTLRPLDAIRLGAYEFAGGPSIPSETEHAAFLDLVKRTRRDLPHKVDQDKLSPSAKIDFKILDRDLEGSIWSSETFRTFETDPRL